MSDGPRETPKRRILYWGDPPTVSTGFGVVARHVLRALHDAGYEIDCLGVNTVAEFYDREQFPYSIVPAGAPPQDPYGYRMLIRALTYGRYDLLFVQNDLHATHPAAQYLRDLRDRGTPLPPILYYYPVDCRVPLAFTGMLALADVIATCTAFGKEETVRTLGPARVPLVIPHGVDPRAFHPLPGEADRRRFRDRMGLGPSDLLISSVASNNVRKDLARTIAAFARFRALSGRPATLYLHTIAQDGGLDLHEAVAASGLTVGQDVVFPRGYHSLHGVSDQAMNELYNASDLYFTTSLGEGWGLPVTEAMAAGLPVVAPRHTSLAEIAGDGRAVLYDCHEQVWVDNAGYRPLGRMDDIVAALVRAASMPAQDAQEQRRMTEAARRFAQSLDWQVVAPRWVSLVGDIVLQRSAQPSAQPSNSFSASNSRPA